MLTVAYLSNEFPVATEPYVSDEICELRRRGIRIIACSVRRPELPSFGDIQCIQPLRLGMLVRACWLCIRKISVVMKFAHAAITARKEPSLRRIKAIAHTFLGAYYALLLRKSGVEHIHVHHGYFASWIAMVAARFLGIGFSMTLHGSDLLLHHAFLELKLERCKFCLTVSEFNRQHILKNYPAINLDKIRVQRMGVDVLEESPHVRRPNSCLIMLAVGRLHPVKDHAFLIRACAQLKNSGIHFACLIAGEGPERSNLEKLIYDFDLREHVFLLGHLSRTNLENYYSRCDLVVLTSRSEGVPLVLMEAMAHGRTVLAPAITGIPELILDGKTGFLYGPGSLNDFVSRIGALVQAQPMLEDVHHEARNHVLQHFSRKTNLTKFAEIFPTLIAGSVNSHENPLLQ